jgi:hypothetical protein
MLTCSITPSHINHMSEEKEEEEEEKKKNGEG